MPISTTEKIVALLTSLSPADVAALPPAERRRLADQCRRAADLAEPRETPSKAGILAALRQGHRGE